MSQTASSEWSQLFDEHPSCQLATYKLLDTLDDVPGLRFLKGLIWQEIQDWVRNDTSPVTLVEHQDLPGPGRIYIGGMNHALNDRVLADHAISAAISIHPRDLLAWSDHDRLYGLRRYGTERCPVQHHLLIPLDDDSNSNLIQHFDDTSAFISRHLAEGHNILIHCKSGRSRSVAVVIAYLQQRYYETKARPRNLPADQAVEDMRKYREAATDLVREQRLPVIIIMERFEALLRLYDLQLAAHPDCERERSALFRSPPTEPKADAAPAIPPAPALDAQGKVVLRGGAAVLKIAVAEAFYKNNQRPMESVVQRLFEVNEAYFYELECSEFKGRSYANSQHACRGITRFYADFAKAYGITPPDAVASLAEQQK